MSQTPRVCAQCGTQVEPTQRFCPNCGAAMPQQVDSTVAAQAPASNPSNPAYSVPPTAMAPERTTFAQQPGGQAYGSSPNYGTPGSGQAYGSSPNYGTPGGGQPYNSSPNYGGEVYASDPYSTPIAPAPPAPPPPPTNPYNSGIQQSSTFASTPQGIPMYPNNAPARKKSPVGAIVLVALALVVILGGGGFFVFHNLTSGKTNTTSNPNGGNGGNGGDGGDGNYAASQNINLAATYASAQFTFSQIKQASKFDDDQYTTYSYNQKKNWIRVVFNEKASDQDSFFFYDNTFTLILPDGKTTLAAKNSETNDILKSGVQRDNWVDFACNDTKLVDLSRLKLQLGSSDEAQITIPLKTGADLSAYQPKTTNLNKQFKQGYVDWTIVSASKSLYAGGKQAKKNQVYIVVQLQADNHETDTFHYQVYGYDSLRLKAGSQTLSPDYTSDLSKLDWINPNTTGLTGTAIFLVTPSPDNNYTLIFPGADNIYQESDQTFQLS